MVQGVSPFAYKQAEGLSTEKKLSHWRRRLGFYGEFALQFVAHERVIDILPDKKGFALRAMVNVKSAVLERPIGKLFLLVKGENLEARNIKATQFKFNVPSPDYRH